MDFVKKSDIFLIFKRWLKSYWPERSDHDWDSPYLEKYGVAFNASAAKLAVKCRGDSEIKTFNWCKKMGLQLLGLNWRGGVFTEVDESVRDAYLRNIETTFNEDTYWKNAVLPGIADRIKEKYIENGKDRREAEYWYNICIIEGRIIGKDEFEWES